MTCQSVSSSGFVRGGEVGGNFSRGGLVQRGAGTIEPGEGLRAHAGFFNPAFFSGVINQPPGCSRTMYCSPSTHPRMVNRLLSALATVVIWEISNKKMLSQAALVRAVAFGRISVFKRWLVAQSQRDCVLQPKVARNELPWEGYAQERNPNGVVAGDVQQRRNPVGVVIFFRLLTQGGSFLATLGFEAESRWDSWAARLALHKK